METNGIVASRQGVWETLAQAVNDLFTQGFTLLAEDSQPLVKPHFLVCSKLPEQNPYPRGRAFDAKREVSWREYAPGYFLATYLADAGDLPPAGWQVLAGEWRTRRSRQKLVGKWSATLGDWAEVAVPGARGVYHSLTGLGPGPVSFQVAVVHYASEGVTHMTRYCRVEPFAGD